MREERPSGKISVGVKRRGGQRGRGWRGAGPGELEQIGTEVPEEGSVKELVSGCKELGREGRDNGGKNLGCRGWDSMECWHWDASEAATPCVEERNSPKRATGCPGPLEAEELEGTAGQ